MPNLAAKLKDAANTSKPELSFQRKAVQAFHSRTVAALAQVSQPAASSSTDLTLDSHLHARHDAPNHDSADRASTPQKKRPFSSITVDSDAEDVDGQLAQCLSYIRCIF